MIQQNNISIVKMLQFILKVAFGLSFRIQKKDQEIG